MVHGYLCSGIPSKCIIDSAWAGMFFVCERESFGNEKSKLVIRGVPEISHGLAIKQQLTVFPIAVC